MSQTFTAGSALLRDPRVFPSGNGQTHSTGPECALMAVRTFFVSRSYRITVLSLLPEATVLPSGQSTTEVTLSVCSRWISRYCLLPESHSPTQSFFASPSVLPSGDN